MRSPLSVLKRNHAGQINKIIPSSQSVGSYKIVSKINALRRKQLAEQKRLRATLKKNRFRRAFSEVSSVLHPSHLKYAYAGDGLSSHKRKWVANLPLVGRKTKARIGAIMRSSEARRLNNARSKRTFLRSIGVKPIIKKETKRTRPIGSELI